MNIPASLRFPRPGFWVFHGVIVPVVLGMGIGIGIFHAGGHSFEKHEGHELSEIGAAGGALKVEMRAMEEAYNAMNRAIILGNTDGVAEAFHAVHVRKQETEEALHQNLIQLPKVQENPEAFSAQDKAFHHLLEEVVMAAQSKDLLALQRAAAPLQQGCLDCHQKFR